MAKQKRKTPAPERRSTTKSPVKAPMTDKQDLSELWAIIIFLVALFIFACHEFGNATGWLGNWLVLTWGHRLFGSTIQYAPAFLLASSAALIIAKTRRKLCILSIITAYTTFIIGMEFLINGPTSTLSWPMPINAGGAIGYIGLFITYALIGPLGTKILLLGSLFASIFVLLNISIRDIGKSISRALFHSHTEDNEYSTPSAWTKLKHMLFYTTKNQRSVTTPIRTRPTKKVKVIKKPAPALTDSSFDMPEPPKEKAKKIVEEIEEKKKDPVFDLPKVNQPKKPEKGNVEARASFYQENPYQFPPLNLLEKPSNFYKNAQNSVAKHQENATLLEETLTSFNVNAKVVNITPGPTVVRYELQPGVGVKISKITNLANDIALKLAAQDVRIEAPIPGKSLIGIEIPNTQNTTITLRNIIEHTQFFDDPSKLLTALGVTISGNPMLMDVGKMPHILIAGATGSGKSVCLNAIIISILLKSTPDEVKMLMIDPKKVELSLYEDIPHLIAPVVTDPNKAAATLKRWALIEMENRYETFSRVGVKNIEGYNQKMDELIELHKENPEEAKAQLDQFMHPDGEMEELYFEPKKLPYIAVIIDELADLMMVASQDVESTICRLAQMARATGIHLIIATQRPSVNVITGLIKANVPSRISFYLQSQIDSRTVLDTGGAEKLLGKGDMLYSPVGSFKPQRIQGVYVSEKEIKGIVNFVKKQAKPQYLDEIIEIEPLTEEKSSSTDDHIDDLFDEAKEIVMSTQYASTSYLQRKLRIGYNRAARIMDELKEQGIIAQYANEKKPKAPA